MNLRKILCLLVVAAGALLFVGLDACNAQAYNLNGCDAQAYNPWGRPTYSGYPAYGYQYYNVHHHHYVYRPHYWHWHPAGWGNNGPVGGWYGGGFIWYGPGNCEACYHQPTNYAAPHVVESPGEAGDEDLPGDPVIPELPAAN